MNFKISAILAITLICSTVSLHSMQTNDEHSNSIQNKGQSSTEMKNVKKSALTNPPAFGQNRRVATFAKLGAKTAVTYGVCYFLWDSFLD